MPDEDPFDKDEWMQVVENKPGVKVLAKVPKGSIDTTIGYFKYPQNESVGPIAANEFIASKIGEKVELPVPATYFKEFDNKKGILTLKVPGQSNMWRHYPYKKDLETTLENFETLGKLIIFDLFILNTDRNPDNLLYSRIGKRKFDFYLIDHANSLYGPSQQPPDYNSFNFGSVIQIEELRELFRKGMDFFKPHIEEVAEIDDVFLVDLVNRIPLEFLQEGQKNNIKQLLMERKKMLYNKMEEFLKDIHW